MVIRTPPAWGWEEITHAARSLGTDTPDHYWPQPDAVVTAPRVVRIGVADLRAALAAGVRDFAAFRTDVLFLCVVYPLIGLLLSRLAFGYDMLPLIFPLASGFALIGPFAAVGLNEMSRRRELGADSGWSGAIGVLASPALGRIAAMGLLLVAIFLAWLIVAQGLYTLTLGPKAPASLAQFAHAVLATPAGWAMTIAGIAIGFLFAVLVLTISAVAFPMLLDRNASLEVAVRTSIRVVAANPGTMAIWGALIACSLALGSLPLLLGLVVVMPVLGHATWHLYRRAVPH